MPKSPAIVAISVAEAACSAVMKNDGRCVRPRNLPTWKMRMAMTMPRGTATGPPPSSRTRAPTMTPQAPVVNHCGNGRRWERIASRRLRASWNSMRPSTRSVTSLCTEASFA